MRKLVIVGFLVVVVAAAAVAVANLSSMVNSKKDYFTRRIEESLGRRITVGKVGISFGGGLGIAADDLSIADLPSFSNEPLLKAAGLKVSIKILPLFKKRLEVKSLELEKPVVNVVRDERGRLNVLSLKNESKPSTAGAAGRGRKVQPLVIALCNINDGAIFYEDKARGSKLGLTMIDSRVKGIDMSRPVRIDLKGAVLSNQQNLRVNGILSPLGGAASGGSMQFAGGIHVSAIDREELKKSRIFSTPPPSIPNDINAYFVMKDNEILIDSLLFEFAGGKVRCSGKITLEGGRPSMNLRADFSGVEAQKLASGRRLPGDRIKGKVHLETDLQTMGSSVESMKSNLTARGTFRLVDGKITEFNVAGEIIREIAKYPGMTGLLGGKLAGKYPGVFRTRDTEIREWRSGFSLEKGRVLLREMDLQAGDYSLKGEGYVDLDLNVAVTASMILSPELSKDIAGEVSLARYFMDDRGSIVVPMRLGGRFPGVSVSLNDAVIQKKLQESLLKGTIKNLLPEKTKSLFPH